jgi:chromosome segregation ATPase
LSAQWRGVISVQRDGLAAMRKIRTVRSLLKFFEDESNCVTRKESPIAEYDRLKDALREAAESVSALKDYIRVLKDERHNLRHTLDKLQRQSGLQYRKVVRPLKEELAACSDPTRASALRDAIQSAEKARALTFVEGIAHAKAQLRQWTRVIVQLRSELRRSERSPRLARMRSALEEIALQAEMSRLERVRSALMASASLPHTQSRPTAWWIPLVDNSGAWFSAIADGTTARLERL